MSDYVLNNRKTVVIFGDGERLIAQFQQTLREGGKSKNTSRHDSTVTRNVRVDYLPWHLVFFPKSSQGYLRATQGVVLLFDLASRHTFHLVTKLEYRAAWKKRPAVGKKKADDCYLGKERFGCILVGFDMRDAEKDREVSREAAESWAESQGFKYFELEITENEESAKQQTQEPLQALVRSIVWAERRNAEDFEEQNFDLMLGKIGLFDLPDYGLTEQPNSLQSIYDGVSSAYQYFSNTVFNMTSNQTR